MLGLKDWENLYTKTKVKNLSDMLAVPEIKLKLTPTKWSIGIRLHSIDHFSKYDQGLTCLHEFSNTQILLSSLLTYLYMGKCRRWKRNISASIDCRMSIVLYYSSVRIYAIFLVWHTFSPNSSFLGLNRYCH